MQLLAAVLVLVLDLSAVFVLMYLAAVLFALGLAFLVAGGLDRLFALGLALDVKTVSYEKPKTPAK